MSCKDEATRVDFALHIICSQNTCYRRQTVRTTDGRTQHYSISVTVTLVRSCKYETSINLHLCSPCAVILYSGCFVRAVGSGLAEVKVISIKLLNLSVWKSIASLQRILHRALLRYYLRPHWAMFLGDIIVRASLFLYIAAVENPPKRSLFVWVFPSVNRKYLSRDDWRVSGDFVCTVGVDRLKFWKFIG